MSCCFCKLTDSRQEKAHSCVTGPSPKPNPSAPSCFNPLPEGPAACLRTSGSRQALLRPQSSLLQRPRGHGGGPERTGTARCLPSGVRAPAAVPPPRGRAESTRCACRIQTGQYGARARARAGPAATNGRGGHWEVRAVLAISNPAEQSPDRHRPDPPGPGETRRPCPLLPEPRSLFCPLSVPVGG